jgi:hypothetical protein
MTHRTLDTATLAAAGAYYAGTFMMNAGRFNRDWVMGQLHKLTFKDEFEALRAAVLGQLGPDAAADFEARAKKAFSPRTDKVFEEMLATKLAITPAGLHIPGQIGTVQVGGRPVGRRLTRHGMQPAHWPVYAGEEEERARGGGIADPLPPPGAWWPDETSHLGMPDVLMALNTNVSIAWAIAELDAARVLLDEGTGIGVIQGRSNSGGQPVDPNATVLGTLLFTLGLAAVALGAAADAAPHALSTAGAIVSDAAADATGTLGYCRGSSTNDGATPLNDHIDGEAGTSGADFNFTTVAIVSGAEISMTSWTVTQPQGPTAT